MAEQGRPIAIGVSEIKMGAVGNGVPGTTLTKLPLPHKGSVVFNFADPTEVKIEVEGSNDPLYSIFRKDSTDYVEFAIPTPDNKTIHDLMGGTHKTDTGDVWQEAASMQDVNKTVTIQTETVNGKYVIYTITNGKVVAKLSQAPSSDNPELLLVRVYKQAAISATGTQGYAFSREVKSAT